MIRAAAVAAVAFLAGCAHQPQVVPPRVVIPVECREPTPERPAMPTDALPLDASVDQFVQAAAAEIDRREAYEDRLRTALAACQQPIKPT